MQTDFSWPAFLQSYSDELLADPKFFQMLKNGIDDRGCNYKSAIASRWLGFAPAAETDIQSAEQRLGVIFPPSYRAFLATSNGWRVCGWNVDNLWQTHELGWFRDLYPDWLLHWKSDAPDCKRENAILASELATLLAVSAASNNDEIYLLNPNVRTDAGEWQALLLSDHLPGVERHSNFRELLIAERAMFKSAE